MTLHKSGQGPQPEGPSVQENVEVEGCLRVKNTFFKILKLSSVDTLMIQKLKSEFLTVLALWVC